jgi:hypothetical protein
MKRRRRLYAHVLGAALLKANTALQLDRRVVPIGIASPSGNCGDPGFLTWSFLAGRFSRASRPALCPRQTRSVMVSHIGSNDPNMGWLTTSPPIFAAAGEKAMRLPSCLPALLCLVRSARGHRGAR